MNGSITIRDLEVFFRVGVPEAERAQAQRLLLTLEVASDFSAAAASDDLSQTIDYQALSERLLEFGCGREWRLIETLAVELANLVISEFGARQVVVEVKKFILVHARWVSVRVERRRDEG